MCRKFLSLILAFSGQAQNLPIIFPAITLVLIFDRFRTMPRPDPFLPTQNFISSGQRSRTLRPRLSKLLSDYSEDISRRHTITLDNDTNREI